MAMNEEALTEVIELLSAWHAKYYEQLGDIIIAIEHGTGTTMLDITTSRVLDDAEVNELFSSIH